MNRIDFTQLGGLPVTQDRLDFLQQGWLSAFSAIARLCGDKTILYGVEVVGSNVTSGFISYNNELIFFQGGAIGAQVTINETAVPFTYADNVVHDVQFTKIATCGVSGLFPFSELIPLLSLQNIWLPGDIKEKLVDNIYIGDNFDVNGYGLNKEIGWRILSKAYPATAGKAMINRDPADATFDTVGNTGGTKTKTLILNNLPANIPLKVPLAQHTASGATIGVTDGPAGAPNPTTVNLVNTGGGQSFSILQPYYVILKTIKL